ncbi:MAG TPA: hypothetical protein VFG00_14085 [Acidothermaceae bacterium]|nr:hypothetical protein [Acidothermaceae bacterium]
MSKVYLVTVGDYSDMEVVQAAFTRREDAEAIEGGDVIEAEVYDALPQRKTWYCIQRLGLQPVARWTVVKWPWESLYFEHQKHEGWNYSKWSNGERAWGTDQAAVEKTWKEQHAAQEALEAGL